MMADQGFVGLDDQNNQDRYQGSRLNMAPRRPPLLEIGEGRIGLTFLERISSKGPDGEVQAEPFASRAVGGLAHSLQPSNDNTGAAPAAEPTTTQMGPEGDAQPHISNLDYGALPHCMPPWRTTPSSAACRTLPRMRSPILSTRPRRRWAFNSKIRPTADITTRRSSASLRGERPNRGGSISTRAIRREPSAAGRRFSRPSTKSR